MLHRSQFTESLLPTLNVPCKLVKFYFLEFMESTTLPSFTTASSTAISEDGRNGVVSGVSELQTNDHVAVTVWPDQSLTPVNKKQPKESEGLAEFEIQSLLWIEQKGNEVYARAYREWERKDLLFASRIDKKKKQSSSLRNEIYQLIGFYSVFQGVLLTAAAQSNLLHCYNWWAAFSLSLLASVVTIAGVFQKFWAILALEKTIQNEADTRQECINRVGRLLKKRDQFDFNEDAKEGKNRRFSQSNLRWSIVFVVGVLAIFSSLFLVSINRVLCHPDDPTKS